MPASYDSPLAKKLNLKSGSRIQVVGNSQGADLADLPLAQANEAQAVILFARTLADVDANSGAVVRAAREDRIAWIAYPKAGQLATDLNRDILWRHMLPQGVQPVRQVAIDDVWSAVRFRPAE